MAWSLQLSVTYTVGVVLAKENDCSWYPLKIVHLQSVDTGLDTKTKVTGYQNHLKQEIFFFHSCDTVYAFHISSS